MIFKETKFKGVYTVQLELKKDARGFFARSYCSREFHQHGIFFDIVQSNISFNKHAGILRGMHYQLAPYAESKLVSCPCGAIYDVIVDLRLNSPTYGKWLAVELSGQNHTLIYIPQGFAHGFQTLTPNSIVLYQMSEFYYPESARGLRWDDTALGIKWPATKKRIISIKDRHYPDFVL